MPKGIGIQLIDNLDEGTICDLKIRPQRDSSGKIISSVVIGNITKQNQALLLITGMAELKSAPAVGVGLTEMVLDNDLLEYRHRIREQFNKEGLKIKTLDLYTTDSINIDAHYGNDS